jgi:hypothetical protein
MIILLELSLLGRNLFIWNYPFGTILLELSFWNYPFGTILLELSFWNYLFRIMRYPKKNKKIFFYINQFADISNWRD